MKSKVALIRCNQYDPHEVKEAIKRGIALLGGISTFMKPGESILLKPNVLVGDNPDKVITTHPIVFQAIAELFKEKGADLFYGDSPAMGKPERHLKQGGYKEFADALGIRLADFQTPIKVSFPNALLAKQLYLAQGAIDAHGIISICKLKTHAFTRITGAVKNQFGCIPGLRKAEYHVKMPDVFDFARLLVDINSYLKSRLRLFVMDGIVAMEGNGPRGGDPVPMNVLLFSTDPVALDSVVCRLIDLNPEFVPTLKFGEEGGLGKYKTEDIEHVGDEIESFIKHDFKIVRQAPDRLASSRSFPTFLKNFVSPRPEIDYNRCVNCGSCVLQCPVNPKAVNWPFNDKKKKPVYDYKKCIRCYCCQEICPEKAIAIKTPFLGRLIHK